MGEDLIFHEKFNKVSFGYFASCNQDMTYLEAIHRYLFDFDVSDPIVRYPNIDEIYLNLNSIIRDLGHSNVNLRNICEGIAKICLYQPFYDGNHRTCLIYQKLLLERIGLNFALPKDPRFPVIDIFYTENEEVSDGIINNVLKISKKR